MKKFVLLFLLAFALPSFGVANLNDANSASEVKEGKKKKKPRPVTTARAKQAIAQFNALKARVEPVGEQVCRSFHKNKPRRFCDFDIRVRNDGNLSANAFQSLAKNGRPIVTININLLLSARNADEIAFVLGHEFGHQIAQHFARSRESEEAGALLGAAIAGGNAKEKKKGAAQGKYLGTLVHSKEFELEADIIGVHIASRAGYNAKLGSRYLKRTGGSSAWHSTHPSSDKRERNARKELGKIRRARAKGKLAPIAW